MSWRHLLFGIDGRIARQRFWIALASLTLIGLGLSFPIEDLLAAAEWPATWRYYVAGLAVTYPASAVLVKRLHDRNRSGRWLVLVWAPFVLIAAGQATQLSGEWKDVYGHPVFDPNAIGFALIAAGAAVLIWVGIDLGSLRGSAGANRFGEDPSTASVGT